MKHTALPWCQGRNHPDEVFADIPGDYSRVAHCGDIGRGESEDNAAFIVKACNTHDALVEACRAAQRYDMAIKGCAFEGKFERLPNGSIATGGDLDALYLDWMTKTYKALALVEMNNL